MFLKVGEHWFICIAEIEFEEINIFRKKMAAKTFL